MFLKKCILITGLLAVLLLSGCGVWDKPQPSKYFHVVSPAVRNAQLAKIRFFRLDGEFSIQQPMKLPQMADFNWKQFGSKAYSINFTSTLGLFSAEIYYQFGYVELWKNGTHVSKAKTPERLMQKAFGWSLPISPMSSWVKGMPAKNAGYYEARYDCFGHLISLRQAGWVLHYNAYKNNDDGVDFPQVILMSRPGLQIKIVITDWLLFMRRDPIPDAIT